MCQKILKSTIFKSSPKFNPFKIRAWNNFHMILWLLFDEKKQLSINIKNCYEKNRNFYVGQLLFRILGFMERTS